MLSDKVFGPFDLRVIDVVVIAVIVGLFAGIGTIDNPGDEQSRKARMKMKRANRDGITCIECHQGIAHELPDDYDFEEEMEKMGLTTASASE